METPRSIKDVAEANNIKSKELARSYRLHTVELGVRIPAVNPVKCMANLATRFKISEKTKYQAIDIMEEVVNKNNCRKGANGFSSNCTI